MLQSSEGVLADLSLKHLVRAVSIASFFPRDHNGFCCVSGRFIENKLDCLENSTKTQQSSRPSSETFDKGVLKSACTLQQHGM